MKSFCSHSYSLASWLLQSISFNWLWNARATASDAWSRSLSTNVLKTWSADWELLNQRAEAIMAGWSIWYAYASSARGAHPNEYFNSQHVIGILSHGWKLQRKVIKIRFMTESFLTFSRPFMLGVGVGGWLEKPSNVIPFSSVIFSMMTHASEIFFS